MSLRSILNAIIGRRPATSPLALEVKFYREAAIYGMHGVINVSNHQLGLQGQPVRFVFKGVHTPPVVTPQLLAFIFEQAEIQGYVPHHVELYGLLNERIVTNETLETLRLAHRIGPLEEDIARAEAIRQPGSLDPVQLEAGRSPMTTEASSIQRQNRGTAGMPSMAA